MNTLRKRSTAGLLGLFTFSCVTFLSVGCGGGDGGGSDPVVVDGSSTVLRISQAAREAFEKVDPNILVVVNSSGTGGGFQKYLQNEVDVVDASRPAKPEEESQAKAQSIDWTQFIVGYDGITLVVNPKNDFVKSLTIEQLKKLWSADGEVKTWKDLDPSWPDRKIVLYSPDNKSGTYEFFIEAILGKGGKQRKDVQAGSDDNILVSGVSRDADSIGYFGYAYFAANKERLKAVGVVEKANGKPVLPSLETILDRSYKPLARPLFIYVKNSAMKRPEVAKFVSYYINNIDALSKAGGYVPPTADDKAQKRQATSRRADVFRGKVDDAELRARSQSPFDRATFREGSTWIRPHV